ncbi:MAG TPA: glycosyltransferase family 39 protein [Candidatus Binataceae bacterium]|jgi:4-amino-4-deoxy-L-arabinose transferase-like glycosyltransferase|nr:glycosyltransferase family 39 protein [Candidatus Binataceae bacterium]
MSVSAARWRYSAQVSILILLCAAIFIPGIASLPTTDRDEALFAQTTKQMVESGDFIRPRFEEQDAFTKPIGIYWAQAAAVLLIGPANRTVIWPYRIPSVLAGLIAVLMTWRIGRTLFDDTAAMIAAGILASCTLTVIEAHLGTTDAMLLASTTAAMACLASIYSATIAGRRPARREVAGLWTAIGLGILVKGPVLPTVVFLTVGALAIADRRQRVVASRSVAWVGALRPQWGLPIALAIVSPWVIAIALASRGLFVSTFWNEIGPKIWGVDRHHGGPPGYYVLSSLVTFWPGSLAALIALRLAFRSDKSLGERFCLAWLVPAWIVSELIPTKLPHYVLPMFPALALIVANAAYSPEVDWKGLMRSPLGWVSTGLWVIGAIAIAIAMAAPIFLKHRIGVINLVPAVAALAIAVAGIGWARRGRITWALWASIAGTLAIYPIVFKVLLPQLDAVWLGERARDAIVRNFGDASTASRPVVVVGYQEPSIAFLIDRPVAMLDRNAASDFLGKHRNAIVLADGPGEAAIQRLATPKGISLREVWSFTGFNYTKGRTTRLALLECDSH